MTNGRERYSVAFLSELCLGDSRTLRDLSQSHFNIVLHGCIFWGAIVLQKHQSQVFFKDLSLFVLSFQSPYPCCPEAARQTKGYIFLLLLPFWCIVNDVCWSGPRALSGLCQLLYRGGLIDGLLPRWLFFPRREVPTSLSVGDAAGQSFRDGVKPLPWSVPQIYRRWVCWTSQGGVQS